MLTNLKLKLSEWYASTKSWFKYSETILIARITAGAGLVTAGLASMDWSGVSGIINSTTGFNYKQAVTVGLFALAQGIILEWARRRNSNL